MGRLTLLCLLAFAAVLSCKKDKEVSPFAGKWSGQYMGIDQGTWSVTVADDGEISGSGSSTRLGRPFVLEGHVSKDGQFLATVGTVGTGSEFTGTLTADGVASGTWTNAGTTPPQQGTWSGSRE